MLVTPIQCQGLNLLSGTLLLDSVHDLYKNLFVSIPPGTVGVSWMEKTEDALETAGS